MNPRKPRGNGRTTLLRTAVAVAVILMLTQLSCIEETAKPLQGSIWPEQYDPPPAISPVPIPAWLYEINFFTEDVHPESGYFMFYIGDEVIPVESDHIPGEWIFRCPFGYHFTYRLDDPKSFFYSFGDPPFDVGVRCFNVGENGTCEYGEGDDVGSNMVYWPIVPHTEVRTLID